MKKNIYILFWNVYGRICVLRRKETTKYILLMLSLLINSTKEGDDRCRKCVISLLLAWITDCTNIVCQGENYILSRNHAFECCFFTRGLRKTELLTNIYIHFPRIRAGRKVKKFIIILHYGIRIKYHPVSVIFQQDNLTISLPIQMVLVQLQLRINGFNRCQHSQ